MPRDLSTAWEVEAIDYLPRAIAADPAAAARYRRTFMAGALAVLGLQRSGVTPEALMAEIVAYGRSVGTCVETAR